jgi:hypothetical protein
MESQEKELVFRVRIQGQDGESGKRIGIQCWNSGSG